MDTTRTQEVTARHVANVCVHPEKTESIAAENWPAMVRIATTNNVAPLLFVKTRGHSIPEAAHRDLRRIYRANLLRNLRLNGQRKALQAGLEEHSIPVIALKGPPLAEQLYGDIGARQVNDIDLLIRPNDLAAADRIFATQGFSRTAPDMLERLQECRDVLYKHTAAKGAECYVDLHLRLRPYGKRDALTERIWHEGLTAENHVLYLCLNLLTRRFARLQGFLDLIALLQKEQSRLDWKQIVASARTLEWTPGVHAGLTFAAELDEPCVPAEVLNDLRASKMECWWMRLMLGKDADSVLKRSTMLDGPRGTLATLGCERGILGKLRLAGSILLPPAPTLRQMDYNEKERALPFHYAERIFRKVREIVQASAS